MHNAVRTVIAAVVGVLWLNSMPAAGQAPTAGLFPPYNAPRTPDGKPDISGIWQALTTANWDIQAHGAQPGPYPALLGAWGAIPGGLGIVEGGEIPYKPEALAKKKQNLEKRMTVKVTNDPSRYDSGE